MLRGRSVPRSPTRRKLLFGGPPTEFWRTFGSGYAFSCLGVRRRIGAWWVDRLKKYYVYRHTAEGVTLVAVVRGRTRAMRQVTELDAMLRGPDQRDWHSASERHT